jgi:hypothetical protein
MRVSAKRVEGESTEGDEDWISSLGLTGSLDEVIPNQEPASEAPVEESTVETAKQNTNGKTRAKRAKAKKS